MQNKRKLIIGTSLLIVLGIIWGSGYTIARYATTHGVPPLGYSFWQSLGPAIFLLLFCLIKEKKFIITGRHIRYYLIAGLLGIAIPNTNMYFAAPHLPAGIVAVIVSTTPILMYTLALIIRQETFNYGRMLGVVLGIIGIMMIVGSGFSLPTVDKVGWLLLTLLTPLFFAIAALYIVQDRPTETSSLMLSAGMLIASAIVLTPLVLDMHQFYPLTSFDKPELAVILEIILSSVGYIILFQLLKLMGAVYYSLVGGIVAVTGIFWGWVAFGEQLQPWIVVAVILIIVAVYIVTLFDKTQSEKKV